MVFRRISGRLTIKMVAVLVTMCFVGQSFAVDPLSQPKTRAVFQRNNLGSATVPVQGTYTESLTRIEARAVVMDGFNGTATDWQVIDNAPAGGSFSVHPVNA